MRLCEKNYTFAIYEAYVKSLFRVKENRAEGPLGSPIQRAIDSKKSFPYLCKLICVEKAGDKQANGSYDGALGLIERKLVDAYLKTEPALFDSDLVAFTPATNSENYLVTHPLYEKSKSSEIEKNFILNFLDFDFVLLILIAEIAFFLIALTFIILSDKIPIGQRKFSNYFFYLVKIFFDMDNNLKKISLISIILLGFVIFDFLTTQILLINVKTSKVIVDASLVISDEEKLFNSPYSVAWLEGERDIYLAQTAPKGTFWDNLYRSKNRNPPIVFNGVNFIEKANEVYSGIFFIMNSLVSSISMNFIISYLKLDFFQNQKPFYSNFNVLYRIKEKSLKIDFLDKGVSLLTEGGFFDKIIFDLKTAKHFNDPIQKRIYTSLDEFIEDHTFFESINLNNFYYLFVPFFGFNLGLFAIFISHHALTWFFRNYKKRKITKKLYKIFGLKKFGNHSHEQN